MENLNTMALGAVRPAGSNADFAPFVFYPRYIVYAAPNGGRTHVKLTTGDLMEVDMPLEKFMVRQRLDKKEV